MNSIQRLLLTLTNQTPDRPPWGEVWIGPAVFAGMDLNDDLPGQIELRRRMGIDLLWLPMGTEERHSQGYRFFPPNDITRARESCDLFIGAVIDGPWQRLADRIGLMNLILTLCEDKKRTARFLDREAEAAMALIEQCLAQGVHAIILAEDLAGQAGPFISPRDVETLLTPFYYRACQFVRSSGALALFHCCGNLSWLTEIWFNAGFQGLAAIQIEYLDLAKIVRYSASRPVLVAGLDLPVHCDPVSQDIIGEFRRLAAHTNLILSTSSGIHSFGQAECLIALYNLWSKNGT